MAIDFTTDIHNVARQIRRYISANQPVPKCTLEQYNTLIGASLNAQTLESGGSNASVGLPTGTLNTTFTTATTTDSVVLVGDPGFTYVLIQNVGDNTVYINFGAPASIGGGLQLVPGANWITQIPQFMEVDLHAIADTAASDLAIYSIGV